MRVQTMPAPGPAAFRTSAVLLYNKRYRQFHDRRTCFTIERRKVVDKFGRVAEWLMAADCKSAAPCGLRRFESSPVHQQSRIGFRSFADALVLAAGRDAWAAVMCFRAVVAQLVERVLGKDEVTSSILVNGSRVRPVASLTAEVEGIFLSVPASLR